MYLLKEIYYFIKYKLKLKLVYFFIYRSNGDWGLGDYY